MPILDIKITYVDRCPSLLYDIFDLPISTSTYRCRHLLKSGGSKVVLLIIKIHFENGRLVKISYREISDIAGRYNCLSETLRILWMNLSHVLIRVAQLKILLLKVTPRLGQWLPQTDDKACERTVGKSVSCNSLPSLG